MEVQSDSEDTCSEYSGWTIVQRKQREQKHERKCPFSDFSVVSATQFPGGNRKESRNNPDLASLMAGHRGSGVALTGKVVGFPDNGKNLEVQVEDQKYVLDRSQVKLYGVHLTGLHVSTVFRKGDILRIWQTDCGELRAKYDDRDLPSSKRLSCDLLSALEDYCNKRNIQEKARTYLNELLKKRIYVCICGKGCHLANIARNKNNSQGPAAIGPTKVQPLSQSVAVSSKKQLNIQASKKKNRPIASSLVNGAPSVALCAVARPVGQEARKGKQRDKTGVIPDAVLKPSGRKRASADGPRSVACTIGLKPDECQTAAELYGEFGVIVNFQKDGISLLLEHDSSTAWTSEVLLFTVPVPGEVRLSSVLKKGDRLRVFGPVTACVANYDDSPEAVNDIRGYSEVFKLITTFCLDRKISERILNKLVSAAASVYDCNGYEDATLSDLRTSFNSQENVSESISYLPWTSDVTTRNEPEICGLEGFSNTKDGLNCCVVQSSAKGGMASVDSCSDSYPVVTNIPSGNDKKFIVESSTETGKIKRPMSELSICGGKFEFWTSEPSTSGVETSARGGGIRNFSEVAASANSEVRDVSARNSGVQKAMNPVQKPDPVQKSNPVSERKSGTILGFFGKLKSVNIEIDGLPETIIADVRLYGVPIPDGVQLAAIFKKGDILQYLDSSTGPYANYDDFVGPVASQDHFVLSSLITQFCENRNVSRKLRDKLISAAEGTWTSAEPICTAAFIPNTPIRAIQVPNNLPIPAQIFEPEFARSLKSRLVESATGMCGHSQEIEFVEFVLSEIRASVPELIKNSFEKSLLKFGIATDKVAASFAQCFAREFENFETGV